ncbi:MAG: hypothetical protein Q4F24_03355 [Eubacteriales bacterium]|nr:hypothetical protein [Eubacteriales bacterium]
MLDDYIFQFKAYPDKGAKRFIWGGMSAVMGEKPALHPYEFNVAFVVIFLFLHSFYDFYEKGRKS